MSVNFIAGGLKNHAESKPGKARRFYQLRSLKFVVQDIRSEALKK
jgi:hypothetical protein